MIAPSVMCCTNCNTNKHKYLLKNTHLYILGDLYLPLSFDVHSRKLMEIMFITIFCRPFTDSGNVTALGMVLVFCALSFINIYHYLSPIIKSKTTLPCLSVRTYLYVSYSLLFVCMNVTTYEIIPCLCNAFLP